MIINNIEEFEDELHNDLAWRKREMINLSFAIKADSTNIEKNALTRAGISLLCAHWEGFIRHSSNAYVMLVSSQKIKMRELRESFITLKLEKKINEISESKKVSVREKLVSDLLESIDKEFTISYINKPGKRVINTNSNLNYALFVEILNNLGIENIYSTKQHYIDSMMLKNRNAIVHGEKIFFKKFDFDNLFNEIFKLMDSYKKQLIYNAEKRKYIKSS